MSSNCREAWGGNAPPVAPVAVLQAMPVADWRASLRAERLVPSRRITNIAPVLQRVVIPQGG